MAQQMTGAEMVIAALIDRGVTDSFGYPGGADLARVLHEAFYIAQSGRPGPVLIDIPKDVQFAVGTYYGPTEIEATRHKSYHPQLDGDTRLIEAAVDLMLQSTRPVFYTGGGVI